MRLITVQQGYNPRTSPLLERVRATALRCGLRAMLGEINHQYLVRTPRKGVSSHRRLLNRLGDLRNYLDLTV
jgi:hypothetical protein